MREIKGNSVEERDRMMTEEPFGLGQRDGAEAEGEKMILKLCNNTNQMPNVS